MVKMANQIGTFFDSMPDRGEALEGIAQHIRKFWVPRMRQRFLAHVDSGGAGLHPLVLQSVQAHREVLEQVQFPG
ncbi:MAG: formate dehydrogenase subunit delta [Giesbergeria sp.]